MKLYAQHGYGPGQKILDGLSERTIEGVIFSARYSRRDKLLKSINDIQESAPHADILLDPEIYAGSLAQMQDTQLGNLEDWTYFRPWRRSDLEASETIQQVLKTTFELLKNLPLTAVIAPNIYIQRSFDSIEAVIAKNFIRKAKDTFGESDDNRPVYATLAISRDTLLNHQEFEAFLNDITAIDNPPDGFYLLVGGGVTEERTELTRSEIIHADVIAGWMLLNYTLSLNGFSVINGCSDILTPFLCGTGGDAGATGWWTNLRSFSMSRYIRSNRRGRQPVVRYLSNLLLNRVKFTERNAYATVLPEINNGLPHDVAYDSGEPNRNTEALQTWEAITCLNKQLVKSGIEESLSSLESAAKKASAAYAELARFGFSEDIEANQNYTTALIEGIRLFRQAAEI